ncbi:MAG: 30S ribosome-binding factor RbfA [Pyrinomonadaceae bacterium]
MQTVAGTPQDNVFLPTACCLLPTVPMHRPERIADTLREEIAQIVGYELEDPRLTMVTVTDVRVADNLRDASVYVTVHGDEQERQQALKALEHAAPYVRKQLGFSLNLRHTPVLHFVRDIVEEKAERVDALLERMKDKG